VGITELREQLVAVGKELYDRGLQTTRSGNLSVRDLDTFLITKTGANLGRLAESDLISVDLSQHAPISSDASCESLVHRAIYNTTDALAIVHAHPIHAIALAAISSENGIMPIHNEGLVGLKRIPIVDTTVFGLDIGEEPGAIVAALTQSCTVIVRNHGAFATGSSLDQALYKMLLLEDTCQIEILAHARTKTSTPRKVLAKSETPVRNGTTRLAQSN
jgi:L-fuculose-phosphate aldolase